MTSPLLQGPILPTLLRLAVPNVFAMAAATAVGIGETLYVGLLGKTALAAMALVFPFVMLMQMFSAGAMGGGVSSAISRALGGGQAEKARALAVHALCIGVAAGLSFTLLLWVFGPALFRGLGGSGEVLEQAQVYGAWAFCAIPAIWLFNTLISLVRGSGNMRLPSGSILAAALLQVAFGSVLGLGLLGVPRLGMRGVALGQVIAYYTAAIALWWYLRQGPARIRLALGGVRLQWPLFQDILRVGALACLSPLLTIGTVLVVTSLVAAHGNDALAGYGIGSRLEFLLVPIAFGVGVAAVPMVGMAIGAGDVARARRVAWTAGAVSATLLGSIGVLLLVAPDLWARWFSSDPAVLAHARSYLRWAGPGFGLFGLGLTLYFAAQGAGNVAAPVAASFLRFLFVLLAGHAVARIAPQPWALFAVVGGAMALYGTATALGVWLSKWGGGVAARTPTRGDSPV
ncbi:MATE family efflux transporter [Ramlibacter sp. XY19]|uniref:MATE family efflux transporter n=1 Tax=Ramlibacter paludis TaxID=2908000 RepID=UPI0023DB157A|nr:MATE family efflux transporter [Ramlibacter paludis]MCG2591194.1 MATE family efflux transporter [Ramlibacter paludis]